MGGLVAQKVGIGLGQSPETAKKIIEKALKREKEIFAEELDELKKMV